MHITYVIGGLFKGGLENWLLTLSSELVRNNHKVTVINLSGSGNMSDEFIAAGVDVVTLDNERVRAGTLRFDTTSKLRKVLKELAPDVVQTMQFAANYHARLAALFLKVPIVTNIHTCVPYRKLSRIILNKILSFRTNEFVSVSKAAANVVESNQNLFRKPSSVIYNGIPDDFTDVSSVDLSGFSLGCGPVFFSVARLVPVKNLSFFLHVFYELRKDYPDAKYVIFGDGSERRKLEALAYELKIDDAVIFAGMRDDVPQLLSALADRKAYFVMPSTGEGFLLAGLEAMAFGISLILSDQIPIKEVAEPAVVSLPLDVDLWRYEISFLLKDKARDRQMRNAGKKIASEFHFSKIVCEWIQFYQAIVTR